MSDEIEDKDKISIEKSPDGTTIIVQDPVKMKPYDQKLMDEISALLKKGSYDEKLQALGKIEKSESSFPAGFIFPIFETLKSDSDERISSKAREVYKKLYGRYIRALNGTQISENFNQTSTAFQASHKAASELAKIVNTPIRNIKQKEFEKNIRSIRNGIAHFGGTFPDLSVSPISLTKSYLESITHPDKNELTLAESLGKDPKQVVEDLNKILQSDKDVFFNYDAYPLLFKLERGLREMIKKRICEPYRKTIQQKIPSDIIDEWKRRRQTERENPYAEGDYDLIDYSDFNDLKTIIEKRSNKKDFSDKLNDRQLASLISKLNELDPIRKKVAHSRPLTITEFNRLTLYANDIDRILN